MNCERAASFHLSNCRRLTPPLPHWRLHSSVQTRCSQLTLIPVMVKCRVKIPLLAHLLTSNTHMSCDVLTTADFSFPLSVSLLPVWSLALVWVSAKQQKQWKPAQIYEWIQCNFTLESVLWFEPVASMISRWNLVVHHSRGLSLQYF